MGGYPELYNHLLTAHVKNPPKYKRRTLDECMAVALGRFKSEALTHISPVDCEHCLKEACIYGDGPRPGWQDRLGFDPEKRMHYEIRIEDWAESEAPGYPPSKCWVRILVSRDRASDLCAIWWPDHKHAVQQKD